MDLLETITVNRQILKLIQSKYEELFPAAYNTPEARYYKMLHRDTIQAVTALKHGALPIPEAEED